MSRIKIINGKVITPMRVIEDGIVCIENSKIIYVGKDNGNFNDFEVIDAKGNYVSPGFVDIHTHGGGGHDFMDGTVEAFLGAVEKHVMHGTTSIVPTTLACDDDELLHMFDVYKEAKAKNTKGASMIGLHLEGPYFSMGQKGAQDPKYIKNPTPQDYNKILDASDDIIRWSSAPELEGAMEFGGELRSRGILPSVAHSDAIYEEVLEAYENGYTHLTHLYSGMSGLVRKNSYRYPGVIESAYMINELTVEIIADGCHLPASILKLVYQSKGADKVVLVTDSMRGAGMPDGETILGSLTKGQKVIKEDGVAKLLDRSAFAGSVATADRLVRNMIQLADAPICDAVKMMTMTPAKIIGAKTKGMLAPGYDADVVIFDQNINVSRTIVMGKSLYVAK